METLCIRAAGVKAVWPGETFRHVFGGINAGAVLVTSEELPRILAQLEGVSEFQAVVSHLTNPKRVGIGELYITTDAYNEAVEAYNTLPAVKWGLKAELVRVIYDKYVLNPDIVGRLVGVSDRFVRGSLVNRRYDWRRCNLAERLAVCLVVYGVMDGIIASSDLTGLGVQRARN